MQVEPLPSGRRAAWLRSQRCWRASMLVLLAIVLVVVACSDEQPSGDDGSTRAPAGAAADGQRIFRRDCLSCHGEDGNRIPVAPLGSGEFLNSRGDATLLAVVADGKGTMPGFASGRGGPLSDQQVRSVVAYMNSQAGRASTTLLAGSGEQLYGSKCASCHGEDGNRIPISPLGAKGFLDSKTDSQMQDVILRGKGTMPGAEKAGSFDAARATSVISFLRYRVQAQTAKSVGHGRDLYVGNCLSCHGTTGDRVPDVKLASAEYLSKLGDGKLIFSINDGTKTGPKFGASKGGAFQVTDTAAVLTYLKSWAGLNATAALSIVGAGGKGEVIFFGNCAACHGSGGDQVPGVQLRSPAFLAQRTREIVVETIRVGNKKGMPAWSVEAGGPLTEDQIASIVDFLFSSAASVDAAKAGAGGGAAAGGSASSTVLIDGKPIPEAFQAKCAVCHGQDRKGLVGPALLPERLTKDNAFYEDTISKGRPGTPMPSWSAQGLTPEQIKALVEFIKTPPGGAPQSAKPAGGASGGGVVDGKPVAEFFQAKCAVCHGQDRKGLIGPALLPERLTKDNAFYEDTISKGRPGTPMPSWSAQGLTPENIKTLVEFIKTPPGGAPQSANPAGGATQSVLPIGGASGGGSARLFGEALFKNTCALCHGLDGLNQKPCPIGSREWISNMSAEGLINRISRGKPAAGMPTWAERYGGPLSDEQIRSVAAYLGEIAR